MGQAFRTTREGITRLLEEIRSWEIGEVPATVEDLAMRFKLDPFIVDRISRSEGVVLPRGRYDRASGLIFESSEELGESLGVPEYVDEDADTKPIQVKRQKLRSGKN